MNGRSYKIRHKELYLWELGIPFPFPFTLANEEQEGSGTHAYGKSPRGLSGDGDREDLEEML